MSKITDSILKDERIEYVGGMHNVLYVPGFFLLPLWGFGLFYFLWAWFLQNGTEVVVTNRRVVVRLGGLIARQEEIPIRNIESIIVDGPPRDSFGTTTIVGTGGSKIQVMFLTKPVDFKKAVLRAQG